MLDIKEFAGARLGVTISGDEKQRHVGFHLLDGEKPELIHLAWHHRLTNDTPENYVAEIGRYTAYECSGFLDQQVEDIVSFVKTVWRRNQHIVPYGIGSDGISLFFDADGSVANQEPGSGLTCATFLMSIFASQLYPIVDEGTWQARDGDKEWQEVILGYLAKYPKHVEEQRKLVGVAYRFRPEEVASSAALYDDDPIKFEDAVRDGLVLIEMLKANGTIAQAT
ncbi:hypothetical protein N5J66_18245 [Pseudomonas juntendi]|uniref:Uncharacterized protein n=1 Tax=Pseudomonas juntendi TaxID=2666183 RepID=A0ABZ2JI13_9PSED|nr:MULTISPECIES: hypothetical protein [Pseudomonas]MDH2015897.1 hypothetical protein [Pseudomonas juntendi]QDR67176.1 hypothetical protein FPB55_05645 [Pseudomonas sp. BJP69]WHL26074.1 hypothetical protein QJS63_13900 [Pseudomonas juntendi]